MTSPELSVSDTKIWSITLELSIMILEASFTLIYDVYSTGITYDDRHVFILQATGVVFTMISFLRDLLMGQKS